MKTYIDAMKHKTVLVIGDVMLDRFVYGRVDRISPESSAPVFSVRRQDEMPGGAGNVVINLQALGVTAHILAIIGNDEAGKALQTLMNKEGLIISSGRTTTVKTRFIEAGGQLLRADEEIIEPINRAEETELLKKCKSLIGSVQAVILSDYNKGVLTERVIKSVIKTAQETGVPVLVDPKKPDYKIYAGADIITPNRKELAEVTGMVAVTDEEVSAAARKLMKDCSINHLVVTRSEDGMAVFESDAAPAYIRNEVRNVVDVSGAGDTAIAALAAGIATGASLNMAAQMANKAGGLVVAKTGTAAIDLQELEGAFGAVKINVEPNRTREAFICDWDEAAKEIKNWQEQGLQVGFTNGCFDILHYGHVNYLNQARGRCDRLVVALNHDVSVKILKGESRPLHDENARATVLGALGAVDMVVFFGAKEKSADNTPCALIEKIKPDIYFKGGDYKVEQLPEAKIVNSYGGTIDIMPLYEGHSTTATIAKMKKDEAA